jgi:UDP:flavonoid glycosyltransferase YjiC (YdhE family)
VHHPGDFYESSMQAAKQLGRRAVLLGASAASRLLPPDIMALPYARYSQIFPRAAVIVYQGGSGTTGQALRAGRPMLFVPYGWDQPDNAARVERLGIGLCLSRKAYSSQSAAEALNRLLTEPGFATRSAEAERWLRQEDGLSVACNAIELVFEKSNVRSGREPIGNCRPAITSAKNGTDSMCLACSRITGKHRLAGERPTSPNSPLCCKMRITIEQAFCGCLR